MQFRVIAKTVSLPPTCILTFSLAILCHGSVPCVCISFMTLVALGTKEYVNFKLLGLNKCPIFIVKGTQGVALGLLGFSLADDGTKSHLGDLVFNAPLPQLSIQLDKERTVQFSGKSSGFEPQ